MSQKEVLSEAAVQAALTELFGWELKDGWLRRTYGTPGWPHTILLVNTIAYLAEGADHHPDLSVGYAKVTVKLQTHSARGITQKDIELARRIDEVALWQPAEGAALEGFPKKWVH